MLAHSSLPKISLVTVPSIVAIRASKMAIRCQPRDNGERSESPTRSRSRSPPLSERPLGSSDGPAVVNWPQVHVQTIVQWLQTPATLEAISMEDINITCNTFSEILHVCGHRTATLPFAMCLRLCTQVQQAMKEKEGAPPQKNNILLFGDVSETMPAPRSLSHLRLLHDDKKFALQSGLTSVRPFLKKMHSLEPGLCKHLILADLLCTIDDVLYALAP